MPEDKKVFLNRAEEIAYDRNKRSYDEDRGQILPFKKTEDGNKWAFPQWMLDTYNAVTLPKDVLQGYKPDEEDIANFALEVGTGGMASSAAAPVPSTSLGMFLGAKSKGANQLKLKTAKVLDSIGMDRDQIWKKTGWGKTPSGEWVYEVSDKGAKLTEGSDNFRFDHDELFEKSGYDPSLEEIAIRIDKGDEATGSYKVPSPRDPDELIRSEGPGNDDIKNVLLHEFQHAVQQREGMPGGTNTYRAQAFWESLYDKAPPKVKDYLFNRSGLASLQDDLDDINLALNDWDDELYADWEIAEFEDQLMDITRILNYKRNQVDAFEKAHPEVLEDLNWLDNMIQLANKNPYQMYRAEEGESMARAVQRRDAVITSDNFDIGDIPFWEDFDIPEEAIWNERDARARFMEIMTHFDDIEGAD